VLLAGFLVARSGLVDLAAGELFGQVHLVGNTAFMWLTLKELWRRA